MNELQGVYEYTRGRTVTLARDDRTGRVCVQVADANVDLLGLWHWMQSTPGQIAIRDAESALPS